MKTKNIFQIGLFAFGLSAICSSGKSQTAERLLVHEVEANLTYVSCAVDGDGNIYSATSYTDAYTYEGEAIAKLQANSQEEILYCVHDSQGELIFYKRIAVTGGNNSTVGRIEFMAVDSLGYAYLSTQGTAGNGFLRVENDSLSIGASSLAGNMVIQLRPDGSLRSVRRFAGIRNVAASDSLMYMAFQDNLDANKVKFQCFDSTFTTPRWSLEGNANMVIGAVSFDRTQLSVSPDGNLIALLVKEGSAGSPVFGGQPVPFQTTQGFDEMAVMIADREGNLLGIRTFFGSASTSGMDELPNAVAIGNDTSVYLSCYTSGTVDFAGNIYASVSGFSSSYGLIVTWDSLGNEVWAVQMLSQTQSPRIDGLATNAAGDLLFGASWAGKVQLGDSLLATGASQRSLTGKISGNNGSLVWSKVPVSAANTVNGQRISIIGGDRFVMSGKSAQGYAYDCLEPVGTGGKSQFLLIINENIPPVAAAAFDLVQSGVTITLTNQSAGATEYLWDFGDGITSTDFSPSHTYTVNGTYTVSLIASNCLNNDTTSVEVTILSVGLAGQISPDLKIYYEEETEQLHLEVIQGKGNWRLMDVQGRYLGEGRLLPGRQEVNLAGQARGVYVLRSELSGVSGVLRFVRH
ncbi:MAG: PKD domain-containing protein [Bacteroidia bacterium]